MYLYLNTFLCPSHADPTCTKQLGRWVCQYYSWHFLLGEKLTVLHAKICYTFLDMKTRQV